MSSPLGRESRTLRRRLFARGSRCERWAFVLALTPPWAARRCKHAGLRSRCSLATALDLQPKHLTVAAPCLPVAAAPQALTPDPRGWVRRRRATTGAGGVSCLNVLPKCSADRCADGATTEGTVLSSKTGHCHNSSDLMNDGSATKTRSI